MRGVSTTEVRDSPQHLRLPDAFPSGTGAGQVSVATDAPAHRPEAESLRESDMEFLKQF